MGSGFWADGLKFWVICSGFWVFGFADYCLGYRVLRIKGSGVKDRVWEFGFRVSEV